MGSEEQTVLRPEGEIDVATAPELRQNLIDAINGGATRVVVDMAGVTFIDSTGLGVLVGAMKRATSRGGEVVVERVPPAIRRVFEVTGLDRAIETLPPGETA